MPAKLPQKLETTQLLYWPFLSLQMDFENVVKSFGASVLELDL